MRQGVIRAWLIVAAMGVSRVTTGAAQDMPVPVDVQVPLFFKILAFDRNLLRRGAGELVIGVLYQGRFRTSADVADKVCRALEAQSDRPAGITRLRVVALDLDHTPSLGAALDRQGVSVLYVSPLRAVDVGQVTGATQPGRITSLTGVPGYVEAGLSVGLDIERDRPQIVVNLEASRAEGADFGAQLLKLARVLGGSEAAR